MLDVQDPALGDPLGVRGGARFNIHSEVRSCSKGNAFRKFGDVVRFPLYSSPGIGTYAGNADPFPRTRPAIAAGQSPHRPDEPSSWISISVGPEGLHSLLAARVWPVRGTSSRPL